jgi:hypothetical protein
LLRLRGCHPTPVFIQDAIHLRFLSLRAGAAITLTLAVLHFGAERVSAQGPVPAPPTNLTAADHPDDVGTAIDLAWKLSPDDSSTRKPRVVKGYAVFRSNEDGTNRDLAGEAPYGVSRFTDQKVVRDGFYLYEVVAVGADGAHSSSVRLARPVCARRQWFDGKRGWFAVIVLLICGAVVWFTLQARAGKSLHVREIAALQAMEEAVGRATEMGRPCLFVPGILDMNEIATVAGITVLSHVAHIAADYDATLTVPTSRSLVMTAARETVQGACLAAGRPEAYDENRIYYVTDEQFAYVAHVTGYMVREKPAACFYAGVFYGESLILAETGNAVGALQIGGTAESSQLPFFVAACDYTLIGEELFAASAYLSREPQQLGSLKGQDAGKLLAAGLLLIGCVLASAATFAPADSLVSTILAYLRDTVLGRGPVG